MERDLREKARAARERAQRAARRATNTERASDEELGYVKTDDSFGKILADAREELLGGLDQDRDKPVSHRVADLLDDVAQLLDRDRGRRKGEGDKAKPSDGPGKTQAP